MKISSIISAFILSQGLASANPAPAAASSSFVASGSAAPSGSIAASGSAAPSAAASFAIAPPASVVPGLSVSIAASAIQDPQETVTAYYITTEYSNDCMRFTEDKIKFKGGLKNKISGKTWLKVCKDGHYDVYGYMRNDDPSGKPHKVGYIWDLEDAAGRHYQFDSTDGCWPTKKLAYKGDLCEWNQNWKMNEDIKDHWNSLKTWHKATGYPVKW